MIQILFWNNIFLWCNNCLYRLALVCETFKGEMCEGVAVPTAAASNRKPTDDYVLFGFGAFCFPFRPNLQVRCDATHV